MIPEAVFFPENALAWGYVKSPQEDGMVD